jgi:Mg-chelatase subunit ChlD
MSYAHPVVVAVLLSTIAFAQSSTPQTTSDRTDSLASTQSGQNVQPDSVTLEKCPAYSQRSGCEDHTIIVDARDREGNFVGSLQAKDLRAKIDGKNVSVLSVNAGTSVDRVVIVLDVSSSMNSVFKREISRFASGEIVRTLPGNSQFALVVFAGKVLQTVPFGASRAKILGDIDQVAFSPHEGQTDLWNSLLHAGELLTPSQMGDSVILVSDGAGNGSKVSKETVQQAYWANGIRLFFVDIWQKRSQTEEEAQGPLDVKEVSIGTGGTVAEIEQDQKGTKLSAATHDIEDQIAEYYLVRIARLESMEKPRALKLEFVDSTGSRRKDAKLTFPQKVLPCPAR